MIEVFNWLISILFTTLILGFIFSLILIWIEKSHFREGRNPYVRICKTCGQVQNCMQRSWGGSCWWEDMMPVPDKECKCHDYSDYYN